MTRKVYKSAMGKPVDLGALLLQNENVRAVGNMNVNAKGDVLNSNNQVIDKKNRQIQRQFKRINNVSDVLPAENTLEAKKNQGQIIEPQPVEPVITETKVPEILEALELPPVENSAQGGLAAAIARSREVKQELEKTHKQLEQQQGLRKI